MRIRSMIVACVFAVIGNGFANAPALRAAGAEPAKLALVIGIGDYLGDGKGITRAPPGSGFLSDLKNPPNDAEAIGRTLRSVGFKVTEVRDPDRGALIGALAAFEQAAAAAGENPIVLIYYSGHGLQIDGTNYLVPAKARLPQTDLSRMPAADVRDLLGGDLVAVSSVLRRFPASSGGANVLILDACRNNPWESSIRPATRAAESLYGLAPINAPTDTLIIYSASPGKVASDGTGDTSPFTTAFISLAMRKDLSVTDMLGEVRYKVRDETQGSQDPWMEGTPPRRLCLPGCEVRQTSGAPQVAEGARVSAADTQAQAELRFWDYIKDQPDADLFDEYLTRVSDKSFPGTFASLARRRAAALRAAPAVVLASNTPSTAAGRSAEAVNPSIGGGADGQGAIRATAGSVVDAAKRGRSAYADGNYTKAFSAFTEAANGGDASSATSLGYMYARGEGVERNDAKALEWYRKGAAGEDPVAINNIGIFYEEGRSVKADAKEANRWYLRSANLGNATAMRFLGMNTQTGLGTTKDEAAAVAWFRKAADLGDAEATRRLGLMTEEGSGTAKDPVAANRLYRLAADLGDAVAMRFLAMNYSEGLGLKKDDEQAIAWYRKAADAGDSYAMRKLGERYDEGEGVARDYAQAMTWYKKAADLGDASAMGNVGVLYAMGRGVKENDVEAVKWYRKAADLGDTNSMTNLGVQLEEGNGVGAADPAEANRWYRKGADGGDRRAMRYLAINYESGIGFEKDLEEAAAWYKRASAAGDGPSTRNLGLFYEEGKGGLEKDPKEANQLYAKAGELGDIVAIRFLGVNTETGLGFPKPNPSAANALYLQAAEAGDATSMRFLGINYYNGLGTPANQALGISWLRKAVAAGDEKAADLLKEIGST